MEQEKVMTAEEKERMDRRERARRRWIDEALRLCPELGGQDDETLEWLGRSEFCLCGEYLGEKRRYAIPVAQVKADRRLPNVGWVCERHLHGVTEDGNYEPLIDE
jgi:hypothetical protein